ncbi:hypothetical protein PoB_003572100 [Plakobranchus ocellatus]|uniref:Uncharacterized protein n=1 Tax=Plakobranchus ocellatus TaxID=259542 RepID=A0AAV4ALZ5_9GAST|nr:hypothetical protein PoB_003572100 [Plakobranchus ocellatus]
MLKGNKLNEIKGGNQKFSRGGDGVGFQPTIAHHYVFHVSMGRSWRWPPYRHHIAKHTSACARSPWTSHPRLSGPPSGRGAGGEARTRDRRVLADIRADSLATVPPMRTYEEVDFENHAFCYLRFEMTAVTM